MRSPSILLFNLVLLRLIAINLSGLYQILPTKKVKIYFPSSSPLQPYTRLQGHAFEKSPDYGFLFR